MSERTVIFLGAGASAADNGPVQSNLLRDYFLMRLGGANQSIVYGSDWDRELATFFVEFFGIDVDDRAFIENSRFPTFEEVLGMLQIAMSTEESFRGWSSYSLLGSHDRLRRIQDLLVFSIAETLDHALRGREVHHTKLLNSLQRQGKLRSTDFISLNYDILADNAILKQHADVDLDYGVQFANFAPDRQLNPAEWHPPRAGRGIGLFKLHGSLNWLYCSACRAIELTPLEKRIAKYRTDPGSCGCKTCEDPCVPVIIPPTYFKVFSNLYLREIWHQAERAVANCDRLVFCGYSFPDADVHVRHLLKRAEMSNPHKLREIYIVNQHAGKGDAARDSEWDRYVRFFRGKNFVHWTDLGFAEFANDPEKVTDTTKHVRLPLGRWA